MADRHLIDVHVLLVDDGDILLTQRRNPNPTFDGLWHLPSGKLDAGESVLEAAAREAEEEVGVLIDPAHLRHVHTMHVSGSGPEPRLGLFFEARRWIGRPTNREPHKCSAVGAAANSSTSSLRARRPFSSTLTCLRRSFTNSARSTPRTAIALPYPAVLRY
jgi:8-oxo-dGTP diphosphatase